MQKVNRAGQITIPKKIREKINLKEGDYIQCELMKDSIVIRVLEVTVSRKALIRRTIAQNKELGDLLSE